MKNTNTLKIRAKLLLFLLFWHYFPLFGISSWGYLLYKLMRTTTRGILAMAQFLFSNNTPLQLFDLCDYQAFDVLNGILEYSPRQQTTTTTWTTSRIPNPLNTHQLRWFWGVQEVSEDMWLQIVIGHLIQTRLWRNQFWLKFGLLCAGFLAGAFEIIRPRHFGTWDDMGGSFWP